MYANELKIFYIFNFKACFNGNLEIAKILCEKGAKINSKTKNGSTPLHLSAQENHELILDYLISLGAKINETNNCRNRCFSFGLLRLRWHLDRISHERAFQ